MLSGRNKVRVDVLDESLDEHVAPSLGGVVIGSEHRIYTDPVEFFKRTLITESMLEVLEAIAGVVAEGRGPKVIVLSAFFGGGKTHTLIALYHAVKNPDSLRYAYTESRDVRRRIEGVVEKLRGVDVVVVDGGVAKLAPTPLSPLDAGTYKVSTLWGYIAHALGRYEDFKSFDHKLVPPQTDDIVRLLSGRRLIIIVDELAQYVQTLYSSADEALRNYARNVVIFMERLAKAVETLNNMALVISLPVKASTAGEGVEIEKIYQTDIVFSLLRSIQRVAARYVEPVKPSDIPALLKVRLFDYVDSNRAKELVDIIRIEYDRNRNVFGDVKPDIVIRIRDSYPFHPLYIDVLLDILDKHKALQKTRDLIRISRKVVRAVDSDRENVYDLIMPWHIDVERDDIRSILLSSDYEVFRLPVEEDIVRRCDNYEKPWIAKAVAKALFVKTFVYGGGLVPKVEFFPTPSELAILTYEPGLFRSRDAQPKDIAEAIEWIASNLLYVLKDERTQRLWFAYIVSPVKYVEAIAQKVTDADASKKLLKAVESLLTEPVESVIERKRRKEEVKVFNTELSKVSRECKPFDTDTRRYIVYTCLEIDTAKKNEVLEGIIYRTSSGGTRRYANTVYVVYPEHRDRLMVAIDYAKKVIACEEVEKGGVVDTLLQGLKVGSQELEIAREVYMRKIDKYCENVLIGFYSSIVEALTKVAYPVMKDNLRTVGEADLFIGSASIVYGVEGALAREGLKKVRRDLDFDTLRYLLASIGIDLNSTSRRVGDIIDYFYSNPKLPAVPEEAIKEAIAEGVRRLEIGLKCRDRVYYKKIETCNSEEKCLEISVSEGEYVESKSITDDCEALSYQDALRTQMESLKGREWIKDGVKHIEEHYLVLNQRLVSVKDVLSKFDSYDPDVLREAPLVKLVKKVVVYLEPPELVLRTRPGEEVQCELVVRRSGPFKGALHVNVDYGDVEPKIIEIDEGFTESLLKWVIKAPKEPGTYSYVLKLVAKDGGVVASAKVNIVVEAEVVVEEWIEGIPLEGIEIERMKVIIEGRDLKPLGVLRTRLGTSVIVHEVSFELRCTISKDRVSRVNINMNNVDLDDLLAIVTNAVQRFGLGEVTSKTDLELVAANGKCFKMSTLSKEDKEVLSKCKIWYKPVKKGG